MGLFDWVMKGIGFEPEDEGYVNQVNTEIPEPRKKQDRKQKKSWFKRKKKYEDTDEDNTNLSSNFSFDQDSYNTKNYGEDNSEDYETFGSSINNSVGSYGSKNFVFYKTTKYEDVKKLVEYLRQSEPAIVDLSDITPAEAQRILDFISGAICALNGGIQRVTGNIFLLVPDGFNITMPQKGEET